MTAQVETVKSNVLKALDKTEGVDYFGVNKPRTTPQADEFAEHVMVRDQKAHRKLEKRYREAMLTQDEISIGVKRKVVETLVRTSKDRLLWATSLNGGLEDEVKVDLNGDYLFDWEENEDDDDDEIG